MSTFNFFDNTPLNMTPAINSNIIPDVMNSHLAHTLSPNVDNAVNSSVMKAAHEHLYNLYSQDQYAIFIGLTLEVPQVMSEPQRMEHLQQYINSIKQAVDDEEMHDYYFPSPPNITWIAIPSLNEEMIYLFMIIQPNGDNLERMIRSRSLDIAKLKLAWMRRINYTGTIRKNYCISNDLLTGYCDDSGVSIGTALNWLWLRLTVCNNVTDANFYSSKNDNQDNAYITRDFHYFIHTHLIDTSTQVPHPYSNTF